MPDLWIPGPARESSLDNWRRRCAQFSELGVRRIYSPSITFRTVTSDDFDATPEAINATAEIAAEYELICMIEFLRNSNHLATLRSALKMTRAADHPNIRPMIDFFHFWPDFHAFFCDFCVFRIMISRRLLGVFIEKAPESNVLARDITVRKKISIKKYFFRNEKSFGTERESAFFIFC